MKICCRCKLEKELSDFNKDRQFKDGLRPFCRECSKKEWLARYWKDPNKERVKYNGRDREKERIRKAKYYQDNKEAILLKTSQWLKNNRSYGASKSAKIRALKKAATPPWLTEIHFQQIKWYYDVAALFTNQTGITNHVDHIHPLKGKNFSGLHVPWNLRVIKGFENMSKHNNPPAEEAHLFWS